MASAGGWLKLDTIIRSPRLRWMEGFRHLSTYRKRYKTRISSLSHLILNPLLQQIQPLVSGLYAGEFAQADNIRALTSSKESMELQANLVQSFT